MQNDMRDRLVELLYENNVMCDQTIEHLADDVMSIFKNDWIKLPCKVGDIVYFPNEGYHDSAEIEEIHIDENGVSFGWVQYDYGVDIVEVWDDGEFSIDEIGKTVFLTIEAKQQAEQKLKELNE